jgi:hypothetical protein
MKINKYFSNLAKKGHKKNPRSKEFYSRIAKIRWAGDKSFDKEKAI